MADQGAGPARKHGRHPTASANQRLVSDRVYAEVDAVQPLLGKAVLDGAPAQADGGQLGVTHDAVLPCSERTQGTVKWAA